MGRCVGSKGQSQKVKGARFEYFEVLRPPQLGRQDFEPGPFDHKNVALAYTKIASPAGGIAIFGGEKGIRTLDTGLSPYNALAGRRLRPLGHLSS